MATPPGRLAPGGTWGRPAAWVGHRCRLSVSPEAGRTRFSGVAPGVASTHRKSHVKSEGGWSAPGCCQNRVVQTRQCSVPPNAIWRPKPTLKACSVYISAPVTPANFLKQGATTMPTNFRPQIWFQVIISVIGRWCQNEICTPVP